MALCFLENLCTYIFEQNMIGLPVWLLISPSAQGKQSKQQCGSPGRLACLLPGGHGAVHWDTGTWTSKGVKLHIKICIIADWYVKWHEQLHFFFFFHYVSFLIILLNFPVRNTFFLRCIWNQFRGHVTYLWFSFGPYNGALLHPQLWC